MLPVGTIPASLSALLTVFGGCFTAPTFATFTGLLTGFLAQTGPRTVCGMLTGAGLQHRWAHDRAHRFFSVARWCPDRLGLALARLIVERLIAPDTAVLVAVDDTLFRRTGPRVHQARWTHDGSRPGRHKIGYGNRWVICGLVVALPFCTRPVCLPVLARLWAGKGTPSHVELAAQMLTLLTAALPGRRIDMVADSAYHGPALRALPSNVTVTTRLPANASLFDLAPPRTGKRGRPRLKGQPLGRPAAIAATATFTTTTVTRYGRTDTVHLAATTCLWHGAFGTQTMRLILLRDQHTTTGYDLAVITADLTTPPEAIITRYAARWSIEIAIGDAKGHFGVGQARNRAPLAVQRTVPFGMLALSTTITWYTLAAHHPDDAHAHRRAAPWYTTKTEPSTADMLHKLRRTVIAARFKPDRPHQPTPEEITAVHHAWAAAAA
jgi:hypothetical protein